MGLECNGVKEKRATCVLGELELKQVLENF